MSWVKCRNGLCYRCRYKLQSRSMGKRPGRFALPTGAVLMRWVARRVRSYAKIANANQLKATG